MRSGALKDQSFKGNAQCNSMRVFVVLLLRCAIGGYHALVGKSQARLVAQQPISRMRPGHFRA
jgi:hypothetical protein